MSTRVRAVSPRLAWYPWIMRSPVHSPCAPAAGWSDMRAIPVIDASRRSSSHINWSAPCVSSSSWYGCSCAKPSSHASCSSTTGLYFMVQDPSGYIPSWRLWLRRARRPKWRASTGSGTAGTVGGVLRNSESGTDVSPPVTGTPAAVTAGPLV
jgi:hypothetical protein